MLSVELMQQLTKSEIMIHNSIQNSDDFDYSITEMMGIFNMSRQTICKSLRTLVEKHLVAKTNFYIGRIKRCRYIINNNNRKNLTGLKKDETVAINSVEDIEKESCRTTDHFLTSKTINTISSLDMIDIYNINNIYKSNQSDNTVFLKFCQEEILKNPKKIQVSSENKAEMIDTAVSPTLSKFRATDKLNKLIRVIVGEKNDNAKKVTHFFKTESKEDKQALIQDVLCNFSRRISNDTHDKIRNIWAYLRAVLVNAVDSFYDAVAMKNECKDVIKATSKLSKDTVIGNMRKPSWHNFEQRQYSDDYFEQFYCTC